MASFIDRVQLPQGCRATAGDSLLLITKSLSPQELLIPISMHLCELWAG